MQAEEWRDFHNRFMHLADKQKQIVRATRLEGYCSFADPEFEGDCCVLPTLESAMLELSKGPDELLKARFEALATAAGKALGCKKDVQPLKFWLYSLFMHLRQTGSRHLFAPMGHGTVGVLTVERAGGIITDVCEASAIFCSRLEKRALEQSEPNEPAATQKAERKSAKAARRGDPEIAKRTALVRSNLGSSAAEMCQIFDRQNVPLPSKWQEAGFNGWVQAQKDPKYRSRIDTLISKDKAKN